MYHGFGWMWGMHWAWWIFWIILVVVLIIVLARSSGSSGRQTNASSRTPLDILKERYAKGEISTQEYNERKNTLEGKSH